MPNYHVGCGWSGIFAGTLKKNGKEWLNKSEVTIEALNAVAEYMRYNIPDDDNCYALGFKMRDGKYLRLKLEISDTCPEWAKEAFGEGGEDATD